MVLEWVALSYAATTEATMLVLLTLPFLRPIPKQSNIRLKDPPETPPHIPPILLLPIPRHLLKVQLSPQFRPLPRLLSHYRRETFVHLTYPRVTTPHTLIVSFYGPLNTPLLPSDAGGDEWQRRGERRGATARWHVAGPIDPRRDTTIVDKAS
ncbi:hypothetical protein Scep_006969 [Stephania cephalantha]|uniref:Uncharacterized protein n=1 Tax=Stephania cephalantha TaxID=152367 RepID=A0AAP0K961_9MAGN